MPDASNLTPLLLVGLGNPGAEYEHTRHNIGFKVIDKIRERLNATPSRKKFHGQLSEATWEGGKILFLKPMTFMNLSGSSVMEAAQFYKIPPEDIIVVHDDLDLMLGKVRIKQGGGNAGHNGLKSVDQFIGKNYWRLRIGIGHPGERDYVHSHVLSPFDVEEKETAETILDAIAEHSSLLLSRRFDAFMSKVAERVKQPLLSF